MKVKLTVLKEDLEEGTYIYPELCPITKALSRAGYPQLEDRGMSIRYVGSNNEVANYTQPNYSQLGSQVLSMIRYVNTEGKSGIPPETFEVEIELDIEEIHEEVSPTDLQDFI